LFYFCRLKKLVKPETFGPYTFLQYTIEEFKLSEISSTSKLRAKSLEVTRVKRDLDIGIGTRAVKDAENY
jgi:hypothetical protein